MRFVARTFRLIGAATLAAAMIFGAGDASAARIKDIAYIQGLQSSKLVGYGLVIGLNRTGDETTSVPFTQQAVENLVRNFGITLDGSFNRLRTDNVAAVMVTADVPAFNRAGATFDVVVSSIGDARSLQGGTLLRTNLEDSSGAVIAEAQGQITTGGFLASANDNRIQKGHVTAGTIPNGGQLAVDVNVGPLTTPDPNAADPATADQRLTLGLRHPDFTTAARIADAINADVGAGTAIALDPTVVQVTIPAGSAQDLVQFIATVENLQATPDQRARVVIDERTGAVVMGSNVQVSQVAVTYANLSVDISTIPLVSQPAPFSQGETVVVPDTDITVTEAGPGLSEGGAVKLLQGATLSELVQALNAIGVAPRDLIAILQLLKRNGALQADLEVM